MTSTPAYSSTKVPVSKSQDELRKMLVKFGSGQFTMGEGTDPATGKQWAGIEFVHDGVLVRLRATLRPVTDREVSAVANRQRKGTELARANATEQEAARVWRVLVWSVKARLVAVEEGLESFSQAFLGHLVNPASGLTLYESIKPQLDAGALTLGSTGIRAIGAGQ